MAEKARGKLAVVAMDGAIRRLIEKLGPTQSGMFFHYDGTEYPW